MYAFEYQRPSSVDAAAAAVQGADARYLAGGQSLVQAMKLRLSSAERLVDLGAVAALSGITVSSTHVTIGAMTRHAAVAASADVQRAIPALADLAGGIGDQMVRNLGTLGGSLANADPAACYPAAVLGLGATIRTNRREIAGDAFFTGLYETALEPGELIVSASFAIPQRAAYVKFKQPASRFAMVGVMVSQSASGVRVGVTGARAHAFRCAELEAALGASFTAAAAAGVKLASDGMNADLHASSEYRAAMVVTMTKRAVEAALAR
jgi:carbon-monoxide dehydrogenase medium subunit